MNFIKKVFDGEKDQLVHIQFQKFSKGEFRDKALIGVKNSKGKFTIKTSAEFANDLVKIVAEKLSDSEKTRVTGAIVSTLDLTGEIEFKEKKQFQGVKRYLIDKEMDKKEILDLLNKFPKNFFGLSFKNNLGDELKIKPKAPKSAKAKNKDESPKADFSTLKTSDSEIAKSFIFEMKDNLENFKQAEINHTYIIDNIKIPDELKDSKDFAKIREESLRCGKIIRKTIIDDKEKISEKEFCA
ncbi:hypothetical protein K9L16_02870 [Candidatus Pacearchaeota archaeon]|nr:hypothetical protein [Candidatus Pacearchaeota archaeon]